MPSASHTDSKVMAELGRIGGSVKSPAKRAAAIRAAKIRWGHKTEKLNAMKFHCYKCGAVNEINIGFLIGSRKSEAKRMAAIQNAKKPPRPGKRPRGRPREKPTPEPGVITPPMPPPPPSKSVNKRKSEVEGEPTPNAS